MYHLCGGLVSDVRLSEAVEKVVDESFGITVGSFSENGVVILQSGIIWSIFSTKKFSNPKSSPLAPSALASHFLSHVVRNARKARHL